MRFSVFASERVSGASEIIGLVLGNVSSRSCGSAFGRVSPHPSMAFRCPSGAQPSDFSAAFLRSQCKSHRLTFELDCGFHLTLLLTSAFSKTSYTSGCQSQKESSVRIPTIMVFYPPSWVPKLPFDPPDTVSIPDFMLDDKWGRHPISHSRPFFTCGLSGASFTPEQTIKRVDHIARALQKELGWEPNKGTQWDKTAGVFALNTIDTITLAWSIHKLGGICTPANAAYSQFELEHQMRDAGAKCIFTCLPLLEMTLVTAKKLGIPKEKVYILELPKQLVGDAKVPAGLKTVSDLAEIGKSAPKIEPLKWSKGEGARRVAFLCYSSGTSGLPVCSCEHHCLICTDHPTERCNDQPSQRHR